MSCCFLAPVGGGMQHCPGRNSGGSGLHAQTRLELGHSCAYFANLGAVPVKVAPAFARYLPRFGTISTDVMLAGFSRMGRKSPGVDGFARDISNSSQLWRNSNPLLVLQTTCGRKQQVRWGRDQSWPDLYQDWAGVDHICGGSTAYVPASAIFGRLRSNLGRVLAG